jgi:uncharacterized membrane protein
MINSLLIFFASPLRSWRYAFALTFESMWWCDLSHLLALCLFKKDAINGVSTVWACGLFNAIYHIATFWLSVWFWVFNTFLLLLAHGFVLRIIPVDFKEVVAFFKNYAAT